MYDPKEEKVVLSRSNKPKADLDGQEAAAIALIAAYRKTAPKASYDTLSAMLWEHDIKRSPEWIRKRDLRRKSGGANLRSD